MAMKLDRSLLGSNPVSGIDHLSPDEPLARNRLPGDQVAKGVVQIALASGAKGITYTLGDSIARVLPSVQTSEGLGNVGLYPLIPYEKAVPTVINNGIVAAALESVRGISFTSKAKALLRGGIAYLTTNPFSVLRSYLEIEYARVSGHAPHWASLRTLVLHELLTDAVVGLDATGFFAKYCDLFVDATGLPPAFETRNFSAFIRLVNSSGVDVSKIIVMTPFNPLGFQMAPSRAAFESTLRMTKNANVIAISVLAAGQLTLDEALEYLGTLDGIGSIAIGTSSPAHAAQTFGRLSQFWESRGIA